VPLLVHRLSRLLAIAWGGVIFLLSSQHGFDIPSLFPGQDKLMHALVFGIFGFLVMGSLPAAAPGYTSRQAWAAIAVVAVYGILDEVHQRFVPGRSADVFDVIADITGGLIGIGLLYIVINTWLRNWRPG